MLLIILQYKMIIYQGGEIMKKFTYEEVKNMFKQRDYELVSKEYVNCETPLEYICNKHRNEGIQDIDFAHFKRGQGCRFCGKENKRSGREKPLEEYGAKELTESKGMEFIKITRENSKLYIYYICPRHRDVGIQRTTLEGMRRMKIGCAHCIGRHKTTESFRLEVFNINPKIKINGEYINASTPIECECLIDGIIWFPKPNALLNGQGCPECGRIASNKNSTKTNQEFVHQLGIVNPDVIPLQEYVQAKIPILVMCKKCGYKWQTTPDNLLRGGSCQNCSTTNNEKKLGDILIRLGYHIERQKKYNDCRDRLPLPFDIYLLNQNILVEYDGEQHYMPVNFGGISNDEAEENLKKTQYHDAIKNKYCHQNNIPLIRVPYWEKNNLEEFIISRLKQYINPFTLQNDYIINN